MSILRGFPSLRLLALDETDIGDPALAHLGKIPSLEVLWLQHTKITDSGLPQLYSLDHLKQLEVDGTRITDRGISALKRHMPRSLRSRPESLAFGHWDVTATPSKQIHCGR